MGEKSRSADQMLGQEHDDDGGLKSPLHLHSLVTAESRGKRRETALREPLLRMQGFADRES